MVAAGDGTETKKKKEKKESTRGTEATIISFHEWSSGRLKECMEAQDEKGAHAVFHIMELVMGKEEFAEWRSSIISEMLARLLGRKGCQCEGCQEKRKENGNG